MERGSRKRILSDENEKMERVDGRQGEMEGYFSTDENPKWAVVPMEEEEEEEEEEEGGGGGGGRGGEKTVQMKNKLRVVQLEHNVPGVYVSAL